MKMIDIPAGHLQRSIFALSQALGESGEFIALRLRTDIDFTRRVADHMILGAPEQMVRKEGLITIDIARAIMGNDRVFGPDQVAKYTGATIDPADLLQSNVIPYKLSTLVWAAKENNYLLVYGMPTNTNQIATWSGLNLQLSHPKGTDNSAFVTDIPVQGWYLICREPVDGPPMEGADRQATLVEIFLALSLHKKVSPRHNFFLNRTAWCQKSKEGGELLFGFGSAFTGQRYAEGSHCYWAVQGPSTNDIAKGHRNHVNVVLPNDLPPIT